MRTGFPTSIRTLAAPLALAAVCIAGLPTAQAGALAPSVTAAAPVPTRPALVEAHQLVLRKRAFLAEKQAQLAARLAQADHEASPDNETLRELRRRTTKTQALLAEMDQLLARKQADLERQITLLDMRARRQAGAPPHVLVDAQNGAHPEAGYRWASPTPGDFRVQWQPGIRHPRDSQLIAANDEGRWVEAEAARDAAITQAFSFSPAPPTPDHTPSRTADPFDGIPRLGQPPEWQPDTSPSWNDQPPNPVSDEPFASVPRLGGQAQMPAADSYTPSEMPVGDDDSIGALMGTVRDIESRSPEEQEGIARRMNAYNQAEKARIDGKYRVYDTESSMLDSEEAISRNKARSFYNNETVKDADETP